MTRCDTERPHCLRPWKQPGEKSSASAITNIAIRSSGEFLKRLDAEYPEEVELPLVMDNYCPHKHARGQRWLAQHPRVKPHFIPTSSSWMNLVERWFAELTGKAVRRGSFSSVPSLIAAVVEFMENWNRSPKPFVWTAKAEDILAKIARCRRRLEEIKPGCTRPRSRLAKTRRKRV